MKARILMQKWKHKKLGMQWAEEGKGEGLILARKPPHFWQETFSGHAAIGIEAYVSFNQSRTIVLMV
jgi:hypothetical protein